MSFPLALFIFGLTFLTFFFVLFFNRVGEEDGRGSLCRRGPAEALDTEVTDRLALEAVVTSACEGLGVSASGSSLRSRVEALYSRAGERMREALHARVKKALAVVSSHYVGIDLPAVCEGYVLPDGEVEAQEEVQRLEDAANAPRDALAAFFDAEVELPPTALRGLRR